MKSWKSLIIPFIIMVVLIIGVAIYFAFTGSQPLDTTQSVLYVNALYVGASDVKSLTVTSSDPSFPEVRIDVSKNDDDTLSYDYNGTDVDPDEEYSDTKMSEYISFLTDYSAVLLVAENANMGEYGLDNPRYTEIIETVNGTTSKVSFGNISYNGENCYIRIDGGSTVYSVPVLKYDYISMKSIDFIDSSVLSIEQSSLMMVEYIRKTDSLDLKAVCQTDSDGNVTYKFDEPVDMGTSIYFDNLIEKICHLEILEYIDLDIDELDDYRLDSPEFHFILTLLNGTKTDVYISENIGGKYYGYVAGSDLYFLINESMLQGLELPDVQYLAPYVFYCQASEISKIKGSYDGLNFTFEIETDSEGSISGDDADVYLDGRNAKVFNSDGRSYCAVLFESFACMEIGGLDPDAVFNTDSTPVMTLDYTTTNYENHTMSFYQRSDSSYYVVIDGEYTKIFVYSKELFNDGGTDTYNYGVWAAYELLKTAIDENVNGVYDIPVTTEEAA